MLTKHGSTSISYDEIGNPLNWRGYINLTWDKRSLTSLDFNYGSGVTFDMSFEYNSDGIRTQKTVIDPLTSDNYTVKYVLDGSKILRETRINNTTGAVVYTMDFMYDDSGVAGFIYNGTSYYYIKNLQGDILYICNASGNIVVAYTYDAWGNILSVTGSMASTLGQVNPFSYRGYYYDSETGLYYLNSRYYDAEVGRFISADTYVSTGQGILGNNMYVYCGNGPTNRIDRFGENYLDYSGLNSYNEIHNAVQCHIVDTNVGMSSEVRAGNTPFRIDLLDSNNGIYEVKPCTYRNTAGRLAASIQLLNYVELSGYSPGTWNFTGTFEHGKYTVTYWTEGSLIFYNFYETKKTVEIPIPVPVEKKSDVLDKVKSKAKDFIDSVEDYLTTTPGGAGIATGAGCMAVVALGTLARYQLQQKG